MDAFTTFAYLFPSTAPQTEEISFPADQEKSGSSGNTYCVVA